MPSAAATNNGTLGVYSESDSRDLLSDVVANVGAVEELALAH